MSAEAPTDEERALLEAAFDAAFYLARNPDVAEAGVSAFEHFLNVGWREGRDPARGFSLDAYLEMNEDVARSGVNPFVHYVLHGRAEGRRTSAGLGFRYALLKNAPSLADQLETNRGPDIEGGTRADLAAALSDLGAHLFITISHDAFVDVVGGIQLCIRRESQAVQASGRAHLHLYPAISWWVTDFETLEPVIGLVVNGEKRGVFKASDVAAELVALKRQDRFASTAFAVHSLLGHSVRAVSAALRAVGAEAGYFWLHDQSSLCASYALLRNDVAFCGAPPVDSPACSICIYGQRRRAQIADHDALFRQHRMTVAAPSQAQLDLWTRASRYPHAGALVAPHAVLRPRGLADTQAADRPLTVAFLGFPAAHKGWPVFEALAERLAQDPRYRFIHLGKQGPEPPPIPFVSVESLGGDSSAMVQAVEQQAVDVAMILSICPETFSFTAHEAVAGGAALLAFADSGAVARFAADPAIGCVVPDEAALAALFESGDILKFSRRRRGAPLFDLHHSSLTADFLPGLKEAAP
jgi:hypothetical protein